MNRKAIILAVGAVLMIAYSAMKSRAPASSIPNAPPDYGDIFPTFSNLNAFDSPEFAQPSTADFFSGFDEPSPAALTSAPDTGNPTSNYNDPGADMPVTEAPPTPSGNPNDAISDVPNPAGRALGVQLNNPGNIRPGGPAYNGQIGVYTHPRVGKFLAFSETQWGMRAMAVLLNYYYNRLGKRTIRDIIYTWAPPNDPYGGNPTAAYAAGVASKMGISSTATLSFPSQLPALMAAMIVHEQGYAAYTDGEISAGVAAA